MPDAPREIEDLIGLMARLPGLGPRSARRAVLALYVVFLVAIILTVVPASALLKRLFAPLLADKIRRQKAYFSQPSGE